jgi:hypothetical protein
MQYTELQREVMDGANLGARCIPSFSPPQLLPRSAEGLEYLETWRDEMLEEAEKGISVIKEKLRLLWIVTGPFYFNPFQVLGRGGVTVPALQIRWMPRLFGIKYAIFGDETEYGRKLSPLEEQANILNSNSWAGLGETVGSRYTKCVQRFKRSWYGLLCANWVHRFGWAGSRSCETNQ